MKYTTSRQMTRDQSPNSTTSQLKLPLGWQLTCSPAPIAKVCSTFWDVYQQVSPASNSTRCGTKTKLKKTWAYFLRTTWLRSQITSSLMRKNVLSSTLSSASSSAKTSTKKTWSNSWRKSLSTTQSSCRAYTSRSPSWGKPVTDWMVCLKWP